MGIVAINVGYLIGGIFVVETVFAYPGLGRLLVDAVSHRDVPVIQMAALAWPPPTRWATWRPTWPTRTWIRGSGTESGGRRRRPRPARRTGAGLRPPDRVSPAAVLRRQAAAAAGGGALGAPPPGHPRADPGAVRLRPDQILHALEPPSRQFLAGTDQFGRDQLSRVMWGARGTLTVAVVSTSSA